MPSTPHTADAPRRALVYGLGASGRAALFLLADEGVRVTAVDDREVDDVAPLEALAGVEVRCAGEMPRQLPDDVEVVVVSPGVPAARPLLAEARRRGVPIIGEVELAYRRADGPVVGVTGSNGKSTTTALTGAMIEATGRPVAVCGNIGPAFSEAVAAQRATPGERVFVVELSSFQIESLDTFHPQAAAHLNLAADHLDRHGSLAAYAAAKAHLLTLLEEGDVAVLNGDDERVAALPSRARRRHFSRRGAVADGCYLEGDAVVEVSPRGKRRTLFARADVPLAGEHNLENAMAAALLALALAVPAGDLRRALGTFTGLAHRMERVAERAGVVFYDDSKGTNPAATLRSLEGFPDGSVHLILGGRTKGADLTVLAPAVARAARAVYLIGEAAPEIEAALGGTVPAERCGTLECAVTRAAAAARSGESVLLSPACASFDQFASFAERGERFQALIAALEPREEG